MNGPWSKDGAIGVYGKSPRQSHTYLTLRSGSDYKGSHPGCL